MEEERKDGRLKKRDGGAGGGRPRWEEREMKNRRWKMWGLDEEQERGEEEDP